jgi:hypothetical protein
MRQLSVLIIVTTSFALYGCAGSPLAISSKTQAELKSETTGDLCYTLHMVDWDTRNRIIKELEGRKAKGTWAEVTRTTDEYILCDWEKRGHVYRSGAPDNLVSKKASSP